LWPLAASPSPVYFIMFIAYQYNTLYNIYKVHIYISWGVSWVFFINKVLYQKHGHHWCNMSCQWYILKIYVDQEWREICLIPCQSTALQRPHRDPTETPTERVRSHVQGMLTWLPWQLTFCFSFLVTDCLELSTRWKSASCFLVLTINFFLAYSKIHTNNKNKSAEIDIKSKALLCWN
jgi:hypothetical protein